MVGIGWVLLLAAATAILLVALVLRLRHLSMLAWLWREPPVAASAWAC